MLSDAAREVVQSGRLAHFTTIGSDGWPRTTVAWVGMEGDEVVIGTLFDQPKLENVRRDPRVTVSIQTEKLNEHGLTEYLVLYGRARVTEGGAPELLQRLAYTYIGPDVVFPPFPNPPAGFVTRIAVERVGGIGPWKTHG